MKKLCIILLSMTVLLFFTSCDFLTNATNGSPKTNTRKTTEEFLDAELSKTLLSQAIFTTKQQTDAKSVAQTTESYYYNKDYYGDSNEKTYTASYVMEKTGTGDDTVIKSSVITTETEGNDYVNSYLWFYKSDDRYYRVDDYENNDTLEPGLIKAYYYLDKNEFLNDVCEDYNLLMHLYFFDPEILEDDGTTLLGKKITTGSQDKYSFRITFDSKHSSTYSDESSNERTKLDATIVVENGLISSINCHWTEKLERASYHPLSQTIDCSLSISYGITEIPLPDLSEYQYEEY